MIADCRWVRRGSRQKNIYMLHTPPPPPPPPPLPSLFRLLPKPRHVRSLSKGKDEEGPATTTTALAPGPIIPLFSTDVCEPFQRMFVNGCL